MKITILISTYNERIDNVCNVVLSPREDVTYIVSHQYSEDQYNYTPSELVRKDITVSHIKGTGVSKSRNNALKLANGDIGLFSDDDVSYQHSDIDTIKKTFYQNSEVDVAIFKIRTPAGQPEYKTFADKIFQYKNAPCVGTIQIAFKINKVKEKGIYFDERFGAGQPLLIGNDEKLFLHDCISSELKVFFFPEYIVEHPYESTAKGIPKYDRRKNWVTGGVDCRINGRIALAKAFFGTVKNTPDLLKHRINPFQYFFHRISAVLYVLKTNKINKDKI